MLLFKQGVNVESQPLLCKHLMVLRLLNMGSSLSCCTQTAVMLTVCRWRHLAQLLQGTASSGTGRNSTSESWNIPSKWLGRNFQGKKCVVQLRELHRWGEPLSFLLPNHGSLFGGHRITDLSGLEIIQSNAPAEAGSPGVGDTEHVQVGWECFQGGRLHNLPGKLFQCSATPSIKKFWKMSPEKVIGI